MKALPGPVIETVYIMPVKKVAFKDVLSSFYGPRTMLTIRENVVATKTVDPFHYFVCFKSDLEIALHKI